MNARDLAQALGGDVLPGGKVLAPGPGHSRRDRSLSVRLSPSAPDGFVVTSFAGDTWQACRDHVADRLGLPRWSPERPDVDDAARILSRMSARANAIGGEPDDKADRRRRTERALAIWHEAADPTGTLAQRYLSGRGLELAPDIAGAVLRFHPRCPWRNAEGVTERRSAMVAIMRDPVTSEPVGIHRTLLSDDARKLDRRMFGPAGAIMLDPIGRHLVAGEGIESCLSARQLRFGPTWALASAGAVERLPVLPGVERLDLLEERDRTSAKAVKACGLRWTKAGREVATILPRIGNDMNDSLRGIAR